MPRSSKPAAKSSSTIYQFKVTLLEIKPAIWRRIQVPDCTLADLHERGVETTGEPQVQGWGTVTAIRLPSGAEVGLYQPRHATAYDA